MQPHDFQVGDRVRTVRKTGSCPKGSSGTVIRVFAASQCSDVRFDALQGHYLVYHGDLELIEQTDALNQT